MLGGVEDLIGFLLFVCVVACTNLKAPLVQVWEE
jgi:hypothetical protein